MATEGYWADPVWDRQQARVYSPSLDRTISEDDPVRLFDEVLDQVDWSCWEAEYQRKRGQPPIHPRYVAAAILYGMYRGIRSSRKLEEACTYRLDFIWLVEGRHIDHTTIAKFRTRFHEPLKDLFRQIGRIAMGLGLIRLCEVGFDGTRVKANNSRYKTRTAKTLAEKLAALDELFEEMMADVQATDSGEGSYGSPTHLPDELRDVTKRRDQIKAALEKARLADEARRQQGMNPEKNLAQIPMTDPDSKVMSNKEGGYAPNYTPIAATDGHLGFIVDADVLAEVHESRATAVCVDRIEETFGQIPEAVLTDAGNSTGEVMQEMEERGVEFYAPVQSSQPQQGDAAMREDPRQPVPESKWPELKKNPRGQLDKSCFIYVPEEDQYYCPLGKPMLRKHQGIRRRSGALLKQSMYRCGDCAGCPLAAVCLSPGSTRGRTITRDQYEEVRERTAARMATPAARQLYNQRPRIAETTFGILKWVMGIRQFLLRGLEKVRMEWLWAATAFNAIKLARQIGKLRADPPQTATEAA